jgi:hypothetical protein
MASERGERASAVRGFPSQTSHILSALSGGAFVVLIVVATLLDLSHPTFDDPPAKFASYYQDNHSKLQIAMLLSMFSTFWLAWFFGFLRWLYEGAERATRGFVRAAPIASAGGIAGVAVAAMAGIAELTAIELNGSVPAADTRMLVLMNTYGLAWAAVLLSVHLLSAFFIIRVTQILPNWIGALAGVGAVLGFFQAVLVLSPSQDNSVFGVAGFVWFAIFLVYVFAASVNLARRAETALLAG